jgi:hypothetical protein
MKTPAEWSLEFGKLCAAKGCDFLCREHVEEAFAEAQREARADVYKELINLFGGYEKSVLSAYQVTKIIALAAEVTP